VFRDTVTGSQTPLQYALALAARRLCDGLPSHIAVLSRPELVEAYEEAWRMFSWSEHLTLELPRTSLAGLSCCLSVRSGEEKLGILFSGLFRRPRVGFQNTIGRLTLTLS